MCNAISLSGSAPASIRLETTSTFLYRNGKITSKSTYVHVCFHINSQLMELHEATGFHPRLNSHADSSARLYVKGEISHYKAEGCSSVYGASTQDCSEYRYG